MLSLSGLPNEILLAIASHLGPSTGLARLILTSKRMHALLDVELYRLDIKSFVSVAGDRNRQNAICDAIWNAIRNSQLKRIEMYIDMGPMLGLSRNLEDCLFVAVRCVNASVVELLAEKGADVNHASEGCGSTPLIVSLAMRHEEGEVLVPEDDADSEWLDQWSETLRALLKCGADPNVEILLERNCCRDDYERFVVTPLEYAIMQGYGSAVEILIAGGADVRKRTKYGTPLHVACRRSSRLCREDRYTVIKALVGASNIDERSPKGRRTALEIYLSWKLKCIADADLRIIQLLISKPRS